MLLQAFPNILAMVAIFLILLEIGRLSTAIPQVLPFLSFIDWSFLNHFGLNALGGLILVYVAGSAGLNTWLMKGFLDTIPREIDESAKVDGATHWQTFWKLIFPLARPMIVVIGVISFIGTFNDFVLARIILRDKENWTMMVGLYSFISVQFNKDWGMFAAGALVAGVPIVIAYLLLQNQLAHGLTAGAVKG
jgi:ABC-type maltose transport system permease subunit